MYLRSDSSCLSKDFNEFRSKLKHDVVALCDLFVSDLDLFLDELFKRFLSNRVDYIDDPLSW